jgi:hypothetical protein
LIERRQAHLSKQYPAVVASSPDRGEAIGRTAYPSPVMSRRERIGFVQVFDNKLLDSSSAHASNASAKHPSGEPYEAET